MNSPCFSISESLHTLSRKRWFSSCNATPLDSAICNLTFSSSSRAICCCMEATFSSAASRWACSSTRAFSTSPTCSLSRQDSILSASRDDSSDSFSLAEFSEASLSSTNLRFSSHNLEFCSTTSLQRPSDAATLTSAASSNCWLSSRSRSASRWRRRAAVASCRSCSVSASSLAVRSRSMRHSSFDSRNLLFSFRSSQASCSSAACWAQHLGSWLFSRFSSTCDAGLSRLGSRTSASTSFRRAPFSGVGWST
mmetsp:Transcript_46183/g.122415  ORF Transcript_46183/g.122415 Transcript_46183/m.122415 type:complete len:252 (-) Transcript_46183:354-1109(-)